MTGNVRVTWQAPDKLSTGGPIPPGIAVSKYVVELAVIGANDIPGPFSPLGLDTPTSLEARASNLPSGDYVVRVTPYDNQHTPLAGTPREARFSIVFPSLGAVVNLQVELS